MNMKVYRKTRYQNIFKHIKNGNYIIRISKPVETSISRIESKKIYSIEEALKIRDNPKIREQKSAISKIQIEDGKYEFDTLWNKYISECKFIKKQAYNTILRKSKDYNKYFKEKIIMKINKTDKTFWASFIDNQQCSDKQKNQLIKTLKAFFNWCKSDDNNYIIKNPLENIIKYRVPKTKMLFWTPEELKKFLKCVDEDLNSEDDNIKRKAHLVKILVLIAFNLGDRIGETRALTFGCVSNKDNTISIMHSINYDTKSKDFLSSTKNYHSQRIVDVSSKLIEEIKQYKDYLIKNLNLDVTDNSIIFFNYINHKPYSDATLRKHFHYYCKKANVTQIRLYDLRHTYVATMMSDGLELYHISERIGHSNYSTTVNKYGHLSNQKRKEIAKTTDKYY